MHRRVSRESDREALCNCGVEIHPLTAEEEVVVGDHCSVAYRQLTMCLITCVILRKYTKGPTLRCHHPFKISELPGGRAFL